MAIAAEMSVPFIIMEWKAYVVNDEDQTNWAPDRFPDGPSGKPEDALQPIRGKFVYIYRQFGPDQVGTDNTKFWLEVFIAEDGTLSLANPNDSLHLERDKRPPMFNTGKKNAVIAHTINGQRVFYFFYVSRIRLAQQSIEALQIDTAKMLPVVDFKLQKDLISLPNKTHIAGAVDPFTVAIRFNREMQRARTEFLNFSMLFDGQNPAESKKTEVRLKMKLLAETINALCENDPGDHLGLDNEFGSDLHSKENMIGFLHDFDARFKDLARAVDRIAASLCNWIMSPLMATITEPSYSVFEEEDYHKYLILFAEIFEEIEQSAPGAALLSKFVQQPPYVINEYILRKSIADDKKFKVGSKAASAVIAVWKAFGGMLIKLHGQEGLQRLKDSIEFISRQNELMEINAASQIVRLRSMGKTVTLNMVVTRIEANEKFTEAKWIAWSKDGKPFDVASGLFSLALKGISLAINIDSLVEAKGVLDNTKAIISALSSLASTISAFDVILTIAKQTRKVLGLVAAVLDMGAAGIDAFKMGQRNDYSAMTGFIIVTFGSVLVAWGCYCAISGAAASATVVGFGAGVLLEIVGAILVVAGNVIAIFTQDSDIETFVNHCFWGSNYGDGDLTTGWSVVPLREFRTDQDERIGLQRQFNALLNLLFQFRIQGTGFEEIRVTLTALTQDSQLVVNFETFYNNLDNKGARPDGRVTFEPHLIIDCNARTVRQVSPDQTINPSNVRFHEDKNVLSVSINGTAGFTTALASSPQFANGPFIISDVIEICHCTVQHQIDAHTRVPSSGYVGYTTWDSSKQRRGEGWNQNEVVSTE